MRAAVTRPASPLCGSGSLTRRLCPLPRPQRIPRCPPPSSRENTITPVPQSPTQHAFEVSPPEAAQNISPCSGPVKKSLPHCTTHCAATRVHKTALLQPPPLAVNAASPHGSPRPRADARPPPRARDTPSSSPMIAEAIGAFRRRGFVNETPLPPPLRAEAGMAETEGGLPPRPPVAPSQAPPARRGCRSRGAALRPVCGFPLVRASRSPARPLRQRSP